MQRPDKTSAKKVPALKSAALLITGDNSPHQDDVVNTNARLDPEISNYFKVSESGGMPLEEQPHKVATSLILFLQGLGYCKLLILYALYSETLAKVTAKCVGRDSNTTIFEITMKINLVHQT